MNSDLTAHFSSLILTSRAICCLLWSICIRLSHTSYRLLHIPMPHPNRSPHCLCNNSWQNRKMASNPQTWARWQDAKYIKTHMNTNAKSTYVQFYITCKIHKEHKSASDPIPACPVCSDVTGYHHGLDKWVDQMLQPILHHQPSYFKDIFDLKTLLENLHLYSNALLSNKWCQIYVHKHRNSCSTTWDLCISPTWRRHLLHAL